jgi:four helix bundle protein
MSKNGFKELKVWQKGKDLAVDIYKLTSTGDFSRDYGLRDQIRRAAVSVASNIAEGDERKTDREAIRFFYMAKGSSAEILTQAIIAHEIGYIEKSVFEKIESQCIEISSMLSKLITARSKTFCP